MDKIQMSGRLALDTTGSKHQIHFNVVVILAIVAPIASTLDLTTFTLKTAVAVAINEKDLEITIIIMAITIEPMILNRIFSI